MQSQIYADESYNGITTLQVFFDVDEDAGITEAVDVTKENILNLNTGR
jgi:hypothetical protein